MKGVLQLLAIVISAIVIMHFLTRFDFEGDSELKQSFTTAIKPVVDGKCNGDSIVFRLDTLTKFEWDKVYFFYSYNFTSSVDERLGTKGIARRLEMKSHDSIIFFMKDGKVVNHVGFSFFLDDDLFFETIADLEGFYIPQNAILSFRKRCEENNPQGYMNTLRVITIPE